MGDIFPLVFLYTLDSGLLVSSLLRAVEFGAENELSALLGMRPPPAQKNLLASCLVHEGDRNRTLQVWQRVSSTH